MSAYGERIELPIKERVFGYVKKLETNINLWGGNGSY